MIARACVGLLVAIGIAVIARRARVLSASGAIAAAAVGTVTVAAGWDWGALLIAFFVTSSVLSRVGATRKEARTRGIVAKGSERDAVQVLANGGVVVLAALAELVWPAGAWAAIAGGALAAATADTWGTEIGTLARARPRLITTLRPVPAGTSGGVTAPGLLASLAGAATIAILAAVLGWSTPLPLAIGVGGMVGALGDSIIGARWQARRRCPTCDRRTERAVHDCGSSTEPAGGVAWLGNDGVNACCAAIGALVALGVAR